VCLFCLAGATGPRRLDISYPTAEFTKHVKTWEKYDEQTMSIIVRHIKRYVYIIITGSPISCDSLRTSALLYQTPSSRKVNDNRKRHLNVPRPLGCVLHGLSPGSLKFNFHRILASTTQHHLICLQIRSEGLFIHL